MSDKQPRSLWKKASNIILNAIKDENKTSNLGSQTQELYQPSLFKGLAEKKDQSDQSQQPYLDSQKKRALYQGKQLETTLDQSQSQVPLRKASISNGIVSTSISKRDSVIINPVLSGGQNSIVQNSFSTNLKDDQDEKSKLKQGNTAKNANTNNTRASQISDTKSKDAFRDFLTPEVLSSSMRKNQLKISDLSMTKYNSVLSGREEIFFAGGLSTDLLLSGQFHNPHEKPLPAPIFTLPPINKCTNGFVSFDQVRQMNASILQTLENEIDAISENQQIDQKYKGKMNLSLDQMKLKVMLKESESLFAEKKRKGNINDHMNSRFDSSSSVTKSFLEQSFTKAGDRSFIKTSIYSPRRRLQYTLQHNKFNQGQLAQIDEKLLQSSSGRLEAILNREQRILHKQRIRNAPSAASSSQEHLQFLNKLSITEPSAETVNQHDSPLISHHSQMFNHNDNKNEHPQHQHKLKEAITEPSLRVNRQDIVVNGDQQENNQIHSGSKKKKENIRNSTEQGITSQQNQNNVYVCARGKQPQDVEGKWKPSIREMFRVCQIGDTAYLFGGCTGLPSLDISAYNLNGGGWCEWDKISNEGEGRYGHVMAVYKKTLLVFGGEKREGPEYCHHVCVNETRIYYPERKEWKYMRPTGDVIEARKSAASAVVGRCLIVHGGINQTGQYLQDLWTLDITSQRWNQSIFEDKSQLMSEGRAYHKACAVYHPDRKNVELYRDNIPDKLSEKLETEIRHEGLYFFGGQLERGQASDKLSILLTNTKPMVFMQPQTLGKPPRSRYNHSLTFNPKMRMLIVYGGMDENLNGSQAFFSDMYVLLLGDLQWKECQIFSNNALQPRSCHEAICHNNQLFIFGGANPDEFYSFDVDLIDLEQQKVRSRIIEGQMTAKKTQISILKNQKTIKGFEATTNNKKRKELMAQHESLLMSLKEQQEGLRTIVEKLNYKNYKSFLPAPQAFPIIPSANHKRNQLDQIKKGELDKEVAVHVGADRIANFEMIQALANSGKSSPSPRSTPRSPAVNNRRSDDFSGYQGQPKKSILGQKSPMQTMKPK